LTNIINTINTDRLLAKVSLRLLPFLLVLYIISYLDRINLSFAALQMNADLHLSDEAYGIGSGIFFFGYCAFGIPSNLVIERLGPRKWISVIMVAWGLVTVCMCLVRDQNTFFALRLILGVAEAGFFPGMLLYLTYWFPPDKYGMAVARFMTAIPLAGVLGSLMAAKAFSLGGIGGLAGWKWLFIVTGLPAVLFGIAAFFFLADRPSQAKWLTTEEGLAIEALTGKKAISPASLVKADSADVPSTAQGHANKSAHSEASIAAAFKSSIVWRFAFLYFSMSVCMYGFQLWLPQIVQTFGHSSQSNTDSQTALLSAIPALFQALGMQAIAASSDRRCERRWHVVASSVITCVGLLSACLLADAWLKLAGLSLAAFGIWGTVGPFWALTRSCLRPKAQPAGIAFINSIGGLGGFFGPYLVGLVKHLVPSLLGHNSSFASALVLLSGAAVVTGILAATSPVRRSD
jgi:ACS family tartrate transporter-like MFS transporter